MQEWWLDETNLGASVAPAFGAAYLRAVAGDRPCASEPYLMSRGNPYGTDVEPLITVSITGLTFRPMALRIFGITLTLPSVETTFSGEDLA